MRAHAHSGKQQLGLWAALLVSCALSSYAVSPCGDTITVNGSSFGWDGASCGGSGAYQNGAARFFYVAGGVGGLCSGSSPIVGYDAGSCTATSFYENTGGGWVHCSGSDVLTSFDLGSCGSYTAGATPTPTPTPEATPTPMHVIIDNVSDFTDGIALGNKVLFCLVGMFWVAIAAANMRL